MSNFKKLFYTLIFILIIKIILIFLSHYKHKQINSNQIYKTNRCILIDITINNMDVSKNRKIIKSYIIATGKPFTPSPIGTWKIVNKYAWGHGFCGRWMGLNIPWGKYGIHGTNAPYCIGQNSSHGCIRMKNKNVYEVQKLLKKKNIIIISLM